MSKVKASNRIARKYFSGIRGRRAGQEIAETQYNLGFMYCRKGENPKAFQWHEKAVDAEELARLKTV
jgi:TPR repeat protein